jgi:hypothetical protein
MLSYDQSKLFLEHQKSVPFDKLFAKYTQENASNLDLMLQGGVLECLMNVNTNKKSRLPNRFEYFANPAFVGSCAPVVPTSPTYEGLPFVPSANKGMARSTNDVLMDNGMPMKFVSDVQSVANANRREAMCYRFGASACEMYEHGFSGIRKQRNQSAQHISVAETAVLN